MTQNKITLLKSDGLMAANNVYTIYNDKEENICCFVMI